jgi:uncharacterized protein YhjY with autotransporter beta-barrel domain
VPSGGFGQANAISSDGNQTVPILRLGNDVRYTISPGLWTWAGVNWARRFDATIPEISGTLVGLFGMTVPSATLARNYVETTGGLRLPISERGALSASVTASIPAAGAVTYLAQLTASRNF